MVHGAFVGEDHDVGEAGAVVDRDVDVFQPGLAGPAVLASAEDAVAGAAEPPELLDVEVHELAGMATAKAVQPA